MEMQFRPSNSTQTLTRFRFIKYEKLLNKLHFTLLKLTSDSGSSRLPLIHGFSAMHFDLMSVIGTAAVGTECENSTKVQTTFTAASPAAC